VLSGLERRGGVIARRKYVENACRATISCCGHHVVSIPSQTRGYTARLPPCAVLLDRWQLPSFPVSGRLKLLQR